MTTHTFRRGVAVRLLVPFLIAASASAAPPATAPATATHRPTILPLGDSITEGGNSFTVYRLPLWEDLFAGGYLVDFVGSKSAETRVGPLKHEGYGGKTAEYLAANVDKLYRANPADVVLLHAGHNHSAEERPVPGILRATERIVAGVHAVRPDAVVLVAQVIPSGKLPKYDYLPELNAELATLVAKLAAGGHAVRLVDQATGFDPGADTVADKVHPNAAGGAKMAARWYAALTEVLPKPARAFRPELVTYKRAGTADLKLHVFKPTGGVGRAGGGAATGGPGRPAIVFFFGGGWTNGTPLQFYREAAALADRGMVAVCADYRVASVNKTTPFESLADAKSAVRYVRAHAAELGVDPNRIAAAGASAGGHLAAAAAFSPGFDDPADDLAVSPRPDARVLWYPVVDNGPGGYGAERVKDRYPAFSPLHALDAPGRTKPPPTLVFLGTQDKLIPVATGEAFKHKLEAAGGRCDLHLYEGAGHPISNYRQGDTAVSTDMLKKADDFLVSIGYLPAAGGAKP